MIDLATIHITQFIQKEYAIALKTFVLLEQKQTSFFKI